MKRIEAIIRPSRVGKVCVTLEKVGCPRPLVSYTEKRDGLELIKYLMRGKTYKADLMNRARVEVIVEDGELDNIVNLVRNAAFTGDIGDGSIFVHNMEAVMPTIAGESGKAAV